MAGNVLCARQLAKSYKEKEVLKNLQLELEPGKIYGLVGRNGAGKTTLLSCLSAQAYPTAGEVLLGDTPIWENQDALDAICFSRELNPTPTNGVIGALKVSDYLRTAGIYFPNWDKEYANRLVDLFELDKKQKLMKLSKGMLSMVTIIVALASKAPFTFLDEPVAGLDVIAREQFYKLLLDEYTETQRTFLVSTHIIEEAAGIFEEVIFLKEGEILLKENTQELLGRSFHVSGREEEVEKAVRGLRSFHKEKYGRGMGVTVLLEKGQNIQNEGGVDVVGLNLQKVFVALCGKEEGKCGAFEKNAFRRDADERM